MINSMEVREDDEEFKNAVDLMFDELKEREPNHFAVRQYAKYKLAAGKTAKSILVSCGARLAVFDIAELRGGHVLRRAGAGHPGRPPDSAVFDYE